MESNDRCAAVQQKSYKVSAKCLFIIYCLYLGGVFSFFSLILFLAQNHWGPFLNRMSSCVALMNHCLYLFLCLVGLCGQYLNKSLLSRSIHVYNTAFNLSLLLGLPVLVSCTVREFFLDKSPIKNNIVPTQFVTKMICYIEVFTLYWVFRGGQCSNKSLWQIKGLPYNVIDTGTLLGNFLINVFPNSLLVQDYFVSRLLL